MARLPDGECSASECSLICNDYWEQGYGRIIMVPRVKLAYDKVSPGFSLTTFSVSHSYCDDKLMGPESIRYHSSRTSELDCYPGLQEDRRITR